MAGPNRQGRPHKLTPERHAKIVELVKHGNYINVACAATGINEQTYYGWLATGRDVVDSHGEDDDEWPIEDLSDYELCCGRFFIAVRKANAEAEAFAVVSVKQQFGANWAAAMTFLERRFPDRWKRRSEFEVNSPFDPASAAAQVDGGVDEEALLRDRGASELMHQALRQIGGGASETVDGEAVEVHEPEAGDA
jgi:transposase